MKKWQIVTNGDVQGDEFCVFCQSVSNTIIFCKGKNSFKNITQKRYILFLTIQID